MELKLLIRVNDPGMAAKLIRKTNNHTYIDGRHYFIHETQTHVYVPCGDYYEIYEKENNK